MAESEVPAASSKNNPKYQLRKRRWENIGTSSKADQRNKKLFDDDDDYKVLKMKLVESEKLVEDLEEKLLSAEDLNEKYLKELQANRAKIEEFEQNGAVSPKSESTVPSITPTNEKSFVLKHVFKNVSNWREDETNWSNQEEHFGVPWSVFVCRNPQHLGLYISCGLSPDIGKWSIETESKTKLVSNSGKNYVSKSQNKFENIAQKSINWGRDKFIEWDKMEEDYLVDGNLSVEVSMEINETIGVYKENLKCFDETMKEFSDMMLVVNESKFFVSKLYLASHSPYFQSMFLGQFQESKKSEIKLSGIDADDFQNYLEVLYGEYAIDETTVEGILLVADMYDTPIVIRKCEEFLMEKSEKKLRKKLEMSTRYDLEQLKKTCLTKIRDFNDIRSVIPSDIHSMDPTIMAMLLEKSLELSQRPPHHLSAPHRNASRLSVEPRRRAARPLAHHFAHLLQPAPAPAP